MDRGKDRTPLHKVQLYSFIPNVSALLWCSLLWCRLHSVPSARQQAVGEGSCHGQSQWFLSVTSSSSHLSSAPVRLLNGLQSFFLCHGILSSSSDLGVSSTLSHSFDSLLPYLSGMFCPFLSFPWGAMSFTDGHDSVLQRVHCKASHVQEKAAPDVFPWRLPLQPPHPAQNLDSYTK